MASCIKCGTEVDHPLKTWKIKQTPVALFECPSCKTKWRGKYAETTAVSSLAQPVIQAAIAEPAPIQPAVQATIPEVTAVQVQPVAQADIPEYLTNNSATAVAEIDVNRPIIEEKTVVETRSTPSSTSGAFAGVRLFFTHFFSGIRLFFIHFFSGR